ncbi:Myeloperoxidase [Armadillidium vulgare]|nr:hypothetical protein Avbf_14472 [Armadillidium vulgare]RXG54808.1 hypothetical protein Avbf_14471 [Armadillidium vulgare]RXG67336.1 hypothetical protein Avbf_18290 [Armadillidium vulgare]RXG67337.1 Myeloperoxidase [Armadillidium vulgare]
MSFKNYICFFTFSLFVSAMADASPSSEDALSKFEEMLYSSNVYIEHLIAKSPEAFKTLREKLPVVIGLADDGKFEEAGKILRSLPVIGEFFGKIVDEFDINDFNEIYDYVQNIVEIYGIEK